MQEENEKVETFDYFNIDVNLLTLHILLEGFYRGQNVFTLDQFLKGDYWKIDEITDEIRDTQDYGTVEDLVLHQILQILRDLHLGTVKKVSVTDLYGLTETIVRKAVEEKDTNEDTVMYYTSMIRSISDLDYKRTLQREEEYKAGKEIRFDRMGANRIEFNEDNFSRNMEYISAISAPFIELEVDFNAEYANAINKEIDNYLLNFYQDNFIENKPVYRQKRFYFSRQLENFFDYLKRFPVVESYVNIPFSSLSEQGFEVVKVLSYLERQQRLKVRNWNDTELWNVKFHKLPITIASLLGQEDTKDAEKTKEVKETKLNLSFSHQTGTMLLTDKDGKEYKVRIQGQVQKEVIRVIFQNPKNTYSEWSLYDISETLGGNDVDKTAVKNAIYQFNKKVKLTIPQVENLFELTKHSARLNPKYIRIS